LNLKNKRIKVKKNKNCKNSSACILFGRLKNRWLKSNHFTMENYGEVLNDDKEPLKDEVNNFCDKKITPAKKV